MWLLCSLSKGPGDCDFDDDTNGFCDWVQMTDDNKPYYIDFMRGSVTPSSGTGPQAGDHTTGNGMLCVLFAVAEYILFVN